jgi:hypothetical protein
VTKQAIAEAKQYVERSLKAQKRLGYKAPARPIVKAAEDEAAAALNELLSLRPDREKSRRARPAL